MAIKNIGFLGNKIFTKHRLISELVKGKSIIHYGCVDDNKELINLKIKEGYYLHKVVTNLASECIGIDMNSELISYLNSSHDINNIVYGDVEIVETFQTDVSSLKKFEVILIPDLIEHLNNPGNMLEGIKKYFSPNVKLLIMTPNPMGYLNFFATILRKEIYTDYHTVYFTTESMKVLLDRYGFKVDKIYPCVAPKQRGKIWVVIDKVFSAIMNFISPGFCDLYMYECSIKKSY